MPIKFSDIPKFTKTPVYHINVSLNYLEQHLNTEIEELGLQLCPDFQRGHVWTTEQQIAYVEYLLRGGQSGKEFYFNRIGGMSNFKNTKADYVCVDGLQRLTAILSFLHNEMPVFGYYLTEYEKIKMADVLLSFNINDLKTRKEVLIWYMEMNSGGTPHTKEEIDKVKKMIESQ